MLIIAVIGLLAPLAIVWQKRVDRRRGETTWRAGGEFGGIGGDGGGAGGSCGGGCGGGGD